VLRGGKSFGIDRHWQPVLRMYITPFMTARMSAMIGKPGYQMGILAPANRKGVFRRCPSHDQPWKGHTMATKHAGLLENRFNAAQKVYGTAIFRFFETFKLFEESEGAPPSLEDVQGVPELYDGRIAYQNDTIALVLAYIKMWAAWSDFCEDTIGREKADRVLAEFEEWVS
jgi:hypothetical protein